jgi:hypothetical protein
VSAGTTPAFRCSTASRALAEPLVGSASTVRAFLLVETPGGWGTDAVLGSRLPDDVRAWMRRLTSAHRVRPLLIRGHGRQRTGGTRVFAAGVTRGREVCETAVLDDVRELLDLDVSGLISGGSAGLTPHHDPTFFVCTHGKHDACCAERGRPLCKALHDVAPDDTWEVSHIGGDRFAPNVLMLPHGLYYGRLTPEEAPAFVAAHREGRLSLPHLRGRSAFGFPTQAAEIFLRRELDHHAIGVPRLVGHRQQGELTEADFVMAGGRWRVRVESRVSEARQLTCRASVLSTARDHRLLGIERLDPA